MGRLTRNEIEDGTQADKRRAVKSKIKLAQGKSGRQNTAKKNLPLRRGQGH
jgi:hypothetical protein